MNIDKCRYCNRENIAIQTVINNYTYIMYCHDCGCSWYEHDTEIEDKEKNRENINV